MTRTYQAVRGGACAGFVCRDGRVMEAAPILRKVVDKGYLETVAVDKLERRGWRVTLVEEKP